MFQKIISEAPWYSVAGCVIVALALTMFLYYRNKKNAEFPRAILYAISATRFVALSFLLLLLLQIFVRNISTEREEPIVILAIDNSASIVANADSTSVKKFYSEELSRFRQSIEKKLQVKTVLFGQETRTSGSDPDFNDKETDIDNLLRLTENNYANQNVGGLIVFSDGIYNRGTNPVYTAENIQFPVFTVALGDTNERQDIILAKINHNQIAYTGNNFPVEVIVNAHKYPGQNLQVEISEAGGSKAKRQITVEGENFSTTLNFTLNAGSPGTKKFKVTVSPATAEKNILNNEQSFVIEVIDNNEKVLIVSGSPHPDIRTINDVLTAGSNYKVEHAGAEEALNKIKEFSMVILHGFSRDQKPVLDQCISSGIPFWIINPVSSEFIPGLRVSGPFNRFTDAESYLNTAFGLFTISDDLRSFVKSAPALKVLFGNYEVSNGLTPLIKQKLGDVETEQPVLAFGMHSGIKYGVFAGDGLWRWKLRDYAEHNNTNLYAELITKCVQYLSVQNDKSFFRVQVPNVVAENQDLEFNAELYNKSYEPITEPDVELTVINEANKKYNYTFSKNSKSYFLNAGNLPAGEYSYNATVSFGGSTYNKKGQFVIREVYTERLNTVADHRTLNEIAQNTGARMFYPAQLKELETIILNNEMIKPVTYTESTTLPLIELRYIFFIILFLLAFEWFIRRRYLSI